VAAHAAQPTPALAADDVIRLVTACLRTAVTAQAGLIKDVKVESERGQWLCEVTLVDDAGKRHKLSVDIATNQVVKATSGSP
jgi:uncharacterized membrane protein YkoI